VFVGVPPLVNVKCRLCLGLHTTPVTTLPAAVLLSVRGSSTVRPYRLFEATLSCEAGARPCVATRLGWSMYTNA
jgi:hypothetical protein